MDRRTRGIGIGAVIGLALLVGLGFITLGQALFTTVGVLLVILGLMGLIPLARIGLTTISG